MTSYQLNEGSFEIDGSDVVDFKATSPHSRLVDSKATSLHSRLADSKATSPLCRLVDATRHVFDAEVGDATAVVVVERAERRGTTLDAIARRRAEREEERLPAYAQLATREVVYGGAPAIEVCARFRRADGELAYLRRTHVAAETLVLSFSLSAPLSAREACDGWMDAALGSLRFRAE